MRAQELCLAVLLSLSAPSQADQVAPLAAVTIAGDRLSVSLRDAPLAAVITDIAARTGIVLHMDRRQTLPRITAQFSELPFKEGLTRLLQGLPGSVVVNGTSRGYAGVAAVYVIASHGEAGLAAQTPAATIDDLRRTVEALPSQEARPDLRQAYDAALNPPPGTPSVSSAAQHSAEAMQRALRDIGNAAVGHPAPATSSER